MKKKKQNEEKRNRNETAGGDFFKKKRKNAAKKKRKKKPTKKKKKKVEKMGGRSPSLAACLPLHILNFSDKNFWISIFLLKQYDVKEEKKKPKQNKKQLPFGITQNKKKEMDNHSKGCFEYDFFWTNKTRNI